MLTYLFDYLNNNFDLPGAGLFQYISFRSALAIISSLLISIVFGNRIIRSLRRLQIGENIRDLGLDGQKEKEGTPTMGGIIIVISIIIPCLLFAKLDNIYIQVLLLSTVWMAAIGLIDDYIKVFKGNKSGLSGKFKIIGQVGLGIIIGTTMLFHSDVLIRMNYETALDKNLVIIDSFDTRIPSINHKARMQKMAYVKSTITDTPFVKENNFAYENLLSFLGDNGSKMVWIIFIPFVIFIVTAVSNATNLTDGLDGLSTGLSAIVATTLVTLAYVSSNTIIADYLNITYIPYSEEMVVFAACFLGACVGFLWHNSFPAKVFMGDTGSLTIGAIIAAMAIMLRKELLIPILCGIFLIETLSVMIQVSYFKYTRKKTGQGKRIFLMSPLHHHFQKMGMHESKIVTRFWIIGIMLAIATMITLKLR